MLIPSKTQKSSSNSIRKPDLRVTLRPPSQSRNFQRQTISIKILWTRKRSQLTVENQYMNWKLNFQPNMIRSRISNSLKVKLKPSRSCIKPFKSKVKMKSRLWGSQWRLLNRRIVALATREQLIMINTFQVSSQVAFRRAVRREILEKNLLSNVWARRKYHPWN